MSQEIILKNVSKFYGKKKAVDGIDLTISEGMFGLLGRNGAGKTTLMKILATLHHPTAGEVTINGINIKEAREIRSMTGYLPQDFSMYGGMSAYEAMDYLGTLSGMKKEERKKRIPELLDKVNLSANYRTKVRAMSGGMRRRLGIAQAILHNPRILIVDEPTAGLDPEERVRFRNLLCEIAQDRIVILSTHIVGDIEATCEDIAVLDNGKIIFRGTVRELIEMAEGKVYRAEISRMELEELKARHIVTAILSKGSMAEVRFLSEESAPFEKAVLTEPNAEDAYLYLMGKEGGKPVCG